MRKQEVSYMSEWMSKAGKESGERATMVNAAVREEQKRINNSVIWAVAAIAGAAWFVFWELRGAPGVVSFLPVLVLWGAVAWNVELF